MKVKKTELLLFAACFVMGIVVAILLQGTIMFAIFAWTMVVFGAIVAFYVFTEICWWIFCQVFKFVDKIVNDYDY